MSLLLNMPSFLLRDTKKEKNNVIAIIVINWMSKKDAQKKHITTEKKDNLDNIDLHMKK